LIWWIQKILKLPWCLIDIFYLPYCCFFLILMLMILVVRYKQEFNCVITCPAQHFHLIPCLYLGACIWGRIWWPEQNTIITFPDTLPVYVPVLHLDLIYKYWKYLCGVSMRGLRAGSGRLFYQCLFKVCLDVVDSTSTREDLWPTSVSFITVVLLWPGIRDHPTSRTAIVFPLCRILCTHINWTLPFVHCFLKLCDTYVKRE